MQNPSQLTEFGKVFIFLVTGIVLVLVTFFVARFIAPNKPNPEKLSTYECGEETTGTSWGQFNSRFYVIALVFLLFDVEMMFIFPWATVFGQKELLLADPRWGWFSLTEMFVFVGILILGLVYVWKKGDLEWIRPAPVNPHVNNLIPLSVYQKINDEVYAVKAFSSGKAAPDLAGQTAQPAPVSAKPAFKPSFRKPAQ